MRRSFTGGEGLLGRGSKPGRRAAPVTQGAWQDVFGLLILGAGVLSGLGVLSSALRARVEPRGMKHKNTRREKVLIAVAAVLLVLAFVVASSGAFGS